MSTVNVILPDLGEGVTEGEVVNWLVKPGDQIEADQTVLEVMTDKATMEVPTPYSGTVKELKVSEGDIIEIETVVLVMESSEGGTAKTEVKKEKKPEPVVETPVATSAGLAGDIQPPVAGARVLASPSTRKLARENNIDINSIRGTGEAGRVLREDVLSGSGASAGAVLDIPSRVQVGESRLKDEREPIRGIRRKIVESMAHSKATIPHFTLMDEANVTDLVQFRKQAKQVGQDYGVNVTYLPLVMKALISALNEFPMFNASIDDEAQEIIYKKRINIGFAADTPKGLVVPVVKNADQKSIIQLSKEIGELAVKARDGKLSAEDMKDATITITNIGSIAGTYATPIINHPQVAIVGMYKIQDKPVFQEGKFRKASVMNYTVTCDHRLIDGAVAAKFLKKFFERIENPSHFMIEMI